MLIRLKDPSGSRARFIAAFCALLVSCTPLATDDRPRTLAKANGNPLALNAVGFLDWYWTMLLVLVGVAAFLRLFVTGLRARAPPTARFGEDLYVMAYLAGGPQRVLELALASLVEQGALRVNAVTRELIAEQPPSEGRPQIERRVRGLLGGERHVADAARFRRWLEHELRTSLIAMRDRLLNVGLLARPALQAKAVNPLRFGFFALLGIGVIRLIAGVADGRPVGFLAISMVLTGIVAWRLLRGMGRERPTTQGTRLLEARRSELGRGGDDKLWMVALLGLAGYGMGPMADLHHVMRVSAGASLFGGSGHERGDSSRGGYGGGGCGGGGCGGGGCGGGGCGG
ncbi:MAG: TIGR04222 domain-containing membrane protein [Chromatiaceae bacterium]|nr:TIGR04222 domain-containing membrane protein [Chromatiaceae bacterium]